MSENPEPTPEPKEPFRPTRIDPSELLDGPQPQPQPQPKDDIQPNPEPKPDPQAEPQPDPRPPIELGDLFDEPKPVVKPDAQPEPKADGTEDEKPGEGEGEDNLPARLRAQLKAQKEELERREQEWKEAQARFEQENRSLREELVVSNPIYDESVQQANSNMESEINRIARMLGSPAAARKFIEHAKTYADKYAALGDIYDEGYDERFAQFRETIQKDFGDGANSVLTSMPRIDELRQAMAEAVSNANSTSIDTRRARMLQQHQEVGKQFQEAVKSTLVYSEQLAEADPYAAQNIVVRMIEKIPHFKEISEQTLPFLEKSLLPPKPLMPEDAPSLSEQERAQAEQKMFNEWQERSQYVQKLIPLAFHALQALPVLARTLASAKSELKKYVDESPPLGGTGVHVEPTPPQPQAPIDGRTQRVRPITVDEIHG